MPTIRRSTLLRALVSLSLIALLAGTFSMPGRAQSSDTIIVGASSDDVVRPLLYAVDAGLFKNAGLDVQLLKLTNGAAVAAAVAGGSVQLGKGSALTPIQAYARGLPITVTANLANYSSTEPDVALLVLKNSPIQAAKDLIGKTIGMVGLNDWSTLGMYAWLDKNGVPIASVKFVELGNSAGPAALEANRIDGNMIIEPVLSAALATGKFRVLSYPNNALGNRISVGTVFGLISWVNSHKPEVERFNRVLSAAEAYVAAHEDATKPLAAAYAGLDVSQLDSIKPPIRTTGIANSDIQSVIDSAAKYHFIPKGFSANDLICSCAIRVK